MKHTPAPWFTGYNDPTTVYPEEGFRRDNALHPLAKVFDFDGEAKANARLIAAAPELLDALEDILAAVKMARTMRAPAGHYDEDVYYNGIDFAPQLDIAAEIVAKAKGEA